MGVVEQQEAVRMHVLLFVEHAVGAVEHVEAQATGVFE
jgi:hypothetical protein